MSTTTLRYEGGAALSFRDSSGAKRRVLHGQTIEVDDVTAELLLATDPAVSRATDVPREPAIAEGSSSGDSPKPTKAELLARADGLGLQVPNRASNAAIAAAIAEEEKRLADEAAASAAEASISGEGEQGGEQAPGDDPEASAAGEPGTPPTSGPVTLGDLPAGARVR